MNLSWISIGIIRICAAVIGRSATASCPQTKDLLAQDSQAPGLQIQAGINRVIPITSINSSTQYEFAPHSLFASIQRSSCAKKWLQALCSSKSNYVKYEGEQTGTPASLELDGVFK